MSTAYFLGAGCSYGTLKCKRVFPPLASQFGKELTRRFQNWQGTYPELAKVAVHLGKPLSDAGLEEIWTCIDYHAKFQGAFAITWAPRGRVVAELKAALLRLYGPDCDEVSSQLAFTTECTLATIIEGMKSGDTLVSFNYDTLAERLFQKRKDGLKLLHCSGSPPSGVVRFAKPHGSASWNLRNLPLNVIDGEPILKSLAPSEVLSDIATMDPLLLGAVPVKSELIAEVQDYFQSHRVYEVVLAHWRVVADAVRDAEEIIVLGYSFPEEDAYGRFFFREAARERTNRPVRFKIYELRNRSDKIKCAICNAFGNIVAYELEYIGEVQPAC